MLKISLRAKNRANGRKGSGGNGVKRPKPAARKTTRSKVNGATTAGRAPSQPTAKEIESRRSVARNFFDPAAAAAARAAFLKRQQPKS